MNRTFLYIDILGFGKMVEDKSPKIDQIFKIFDSLNVFKHQSLHVVIFSDTILVFNKENDWPVHYFVTYVIEYAQELFYKLSHINVYFKGIITLGEFNFNELTNFQAYYGDALVETYHDETTLEGFGLYINKSIYSEVVTFETVPFNEKYHYVLLCQSYINLYDYQEGVLPIDLDILEETDSYFRIDEDLRFFREIEYIKNNHPSDKIKVKYQKVYDTFKARTPKFFEIFEEQGFLPFALHEDFLGSINPFELLAERELGGN